VRRDMLRHQCVAETELTRRVLKALHRDQRLDMRTRLKAMLQLHGMPSYTRGTELKPRCTITGMFCILFIFIEFLRLSC
jgi:hypothetical protein